MELINLLLNECDILCVQETLLFEFSNDILSRFSIDNNFEYQGATKTNVFAGHPSGGLVTFWKSSLNSMVSVTFKTDRCICIKLNSCGKESIVVNTYNPCDYGNDDCLLSYRGALMELETNLENESSDDLFIVGDLNADPNKGRFFSELNCFIRSS